MALDGAMLSQVRGELLPAIGCRIDKIAQPSREEIILSLRGRGCVYKVLISVGASNARIHLTTVAVENPKSPPMFCMLMRKHLGGARLSAIEQVGLDRILNLKFESVSELGDPITLTLALEIMGRYSNLMLLDQNGKIIDALKRVDEEMSSVRSVLPGMTYQLPPGQPEKLNLMETTPDAILEKLRAQRETVDLSKRLLECLQGVSPLLCREIAYFALRGRDGTPADMTGEEITRLRFYLGTLMDNMKAHRSTPTMVLEPAGKPKDFSFVPIHQYGISMLTREYESLSALLDVFYSERDAIDRMRQRSNDLLKFLVNTSDRIARRLATQQEELKATADREELKVKGDLLSTYLYTLKKGDREAVLENYYEESLPKVTIQLDPMLTPVQNVQRYYTKYRKADTAEKKLLGLIAEGEEEQRYIESVFDALVRARSEDELDAIRRELAEQGYLKSYVLRGKKPAKLAPIHYRSSDGFDILVGRNNVQNDRLTLKDSRGNDIWFHTQKIPGSHTIVVSEGKTVPNRTLEQAAILAAYHSQARDSSKVAVDYTPVRYVKKPGGAKPGMVIYETYQTAIVDPSAELAAELLVKDK